MSIQRIFPADEYLYSAYLILHGGILVFFFLLSYFATEKIVVCVFLLYLFCQAQTEYYGKRKTVNVKHTECGKVNIVFDFFFVRPEDGRKCEGLLSTFC